MVKGKRIIEKLKGGMKSGSDGQVHLMETELDIIEKNKEKEILLQIRTDYYDRKNREVKAS